MSKNRSQFLFDVFMSHASVDTVVARRLSILLKDAGLNVWLDEWEIFPGDDIFLKIEEGVESSRVLVALFSEASLRSDWVSMERSSALFRDPRNKDRRFIPVRIEDCELPSVLRRMRCIDIGAGVDAVARKLIESIQQSAGVMGRIEKQVDNSVTLLADGREVEANIGKALDGYADAWKFVESENQPAVVAFLDIDGFTYINAKIGRKASDDLILVVFEVIKKCLPDSCGIWYWNADEFVILMPGCSEQKAASLLTGVVRGVNDYCWDEFSVRLFVSVSIGYASRKTVRQEPNCELLERAIIGMRSAKMKGGGRIHRGPIVPRLSPEQARERELNRKEPRYWANWSTS